MNEQATITMSRKTLERLQEDYWTLTLDESEQVSQALEAMKLNDQLEPINAVPNPAGTVSSPHIQFNN